MLVVSALSGITNLLTAVADESDVAKRSTLLAEITQRHRDLMAELNLTECALLQGHLSSLELFVSGLAYPVPPSDRALLLAHGELMSSSIGFQALDSRGFSACWQDARKMLKAVAGMEQNPLAVRCDDEADESLQQQLLSQGSLHITQGFIASGKDGQTCLLGRGGSDTSAAYLAARLQAAALEIWTDVPGMFTADPRVVPDARLLCSLGYREAQELASMGAKVLHPPSIQPARRHRIPLYIKDTGRPSANRTLITAGSMW